MRGVRFVEADNTKTLAPPIVARDNYLGAELDKGMVRRRRNELRRLAPLRPKTLIARRARHCVAILSLLSGGKRADRLRQLAVDLRQALGRHQIRMRRNLAVGQRFTRTRAIIVFNKRFVHGTMPSVAITLAISGLSFTAAAMSASPPILSPAFRLTMLRPNRAFALLGLSEIAVE